MHILLLNSTEGERKTSFLLIISFQLSSSITIQYLCFFKAGKKPQNSRVAVYAWKWNLFSQCRTRYAFLDQNTSFDLKDFPQQHSNKWKLSKTKNRLRNDSCFLVYAINFKGKTAELVTYSLRLTWNSLMTPDFVPCDFHGKAYFWHWEVYKACSIESFWNVYFKSITGKKKWSTNPTSTANTNWWRDSLRGISQPVPPLLALCEWPPTFM